MYESIFDTWFSPWLCRSPVQRLQERPIADAGERAQIFCSWGARIVAAKTGK